MTTLIVTPQEIIKKTPLNGNVDASKYLYFIELAQKSYVENALGTALYNKILTEIESETLAGDYLLLVDKYLKPALVNLVVADYVEIANYQVTNGGVFKNNSSNGQVVEKDETTYLSLSLRGKAQSFLNDMERFLCDTNIPEYKDPQVNNYDSKPKNNKGILGGWYL